MITRTNSHNDWTDRGGQVIGDPAIEVIAPDLVRTAYLRADTFKDCDALQPISAKHQVTIEFRIVGGKTELVR